MITIGEKKRGLNGIYIFLLFLGGFMIILPFLIDKFSQLSQYLIFLVFGLFIMGIAAYYLYSIAKTPDKVITYNPVTGMLLLNGTEKLHITSISDISYKKARSKHHEYEWGVVIINKSIKCNFVDHCENVSKELLKLTYEYKEF